MDEQSHNRLLEALDAAGDEVAPKLAESLKESGQRMLAEHAEIRHGFESRVRATWGKAIDLLEMIYVSSQEAGAEFNRKERPAAVEENDFKFEALTGLHARACVTTSEILALLKSGHPTGAYSRWRTLHEIAVTAGVLGTSDQELAEMFLLHNRIEAARNARAYQLHAEALSVEPYTEAEMAAFASAERELIKRFGSDYKRDYGWAARLGIELSFVALEEHAGLSHQRPIYQMASHGVHATAKSLDLNIGQRGPTTTMLAGVTNHGFEGVGHGAAISLCQATSSLLLFGREAVPPPSTFLVVKALLHLVDEAGVVFGQASHELNQAEEEFWKARGFPPEDESEFG